MQIDDNKAVVITGAASGIGRATALSVAARGAALGLCDLDGELLERTAEEARAQGARRVFTRVVDVGSPDAMQRFAELVQRELGPPDVLVNNAGVGLFGGFMSTSLEDWRWITDTNYWGVVHGCHYFLPAMVARAERAHVVNVASAAGLIASEALCAYSTTKYAIVGLSEALRVELAARRIGVSVVCPGFVNTPIVERMRVRGAGDPALVRRQVAAWYQQRDFEPERVAEAIWVAVRENRAIVPVAPEAHLLHALKRLMPALAPRFLRWSGKWFGPKGVE